MLHHLPYSATACPLYPASTIHRLMRCGNTEYELCGEIYLHSSRLGSGACWLVVSRVHSIPWHVGELGIKRAGSMHSDGVTLKASVEHELYHYALAPGLWKYGIGGFHPVDGMLSLSLSLLIVTRLTHTCSSFNLWRLFLVYLLFAKVFSS